MISATWQKLWRWRDQAKELFLFFVKPNVDKLEKQNQSQSLEQQNGGDDEEPRSYTTRQVIGLILGPLLFVITMLFFKPTDLSTQGIAILASTLWIATWWITEALPIPVTSLLPLILFPLTQGLDIKATASSYGDETIFFYSWVDL